MLNPPPLPGKPLYLPKPRKPEGVVRQLLEAGAGGDNQQIYLFSSGRAQANITPPLLVSTYWR